MRTLSSRGSSPSAIFLISHSHFGGAQELWANLANGFRDAGWNAELAALYPDEEGEQPTPAGLDWNYLAEHRPRGPLGSAGLMTALARRLRADPPTVIFTALPAANVIVPAVITMARVDTKVVTTHHTPSHTYNQKLHAADALTGRLPCVAHIVSVSNAVGASLRSRPAGYVAKLATIRNAVPPDVEKLLVELASARSMPGKPRRLLVCSGRLAEQKNYPVVIKAMRHLPDVQLQIVGGGPDEVSLKELADKCGVSDRIQFLGQKNRVEALRLVSDAGIFVQMSLFEGNSLSLIEAAKLGLPIIISDVPEQREAITNEAGELCGIAVDRNDDMGLARAVNQLLDDKESYARFAQSALSLGNGIRFSALIQSYLALAEPMLGHASHRQ